MKSAKPALRAPSSWLWGVVAAALSALLLALYWSTHPIAAAAVVNITQARLHVPQSGNSPDPTVSLPHVIEPELVRAHDFVEYRIAWPAELAGQERVALLLPRVGMRFRVLLGEEEIYEYGWYEPDGVTVVSAARPHFVLLPQPLGAAKERGDLRIQVRGHALERSGLWPLRLGEPHSVRKRYELLEFWQVHATLMMAAISALVTILSLSMGALLRERLFWLVTVAAAAHCARSALLVMTYTPLSYEWLYVLNRLLLGVHGMFFVLTIEDLFERAYPVIRRAAWACLALSPLMLGATVWTENYDWTRLWAAILVLLSVFGLAWALVDQVIRRAINTDRIIIYLAAGFMLMTAIRDFAVIQFHLPGDGDIRWMTVGGIALMLALGLVIIRRSAEWSLKLHALNAELDARVKQREDELRSAYKSLEKERIRQASEQERRRIMREMHDGLGSQLVQALSYIQSSAPKVDAAVIRDMLTQALTELRMTLDSLEQTGGDIPAILGTLRRRIEPALKAAGIKLGWEVDEIKPLQRLDSMAVLHIFRCLQEATTNILKHAHASAVVFKAFEDDQGIHIIIQDNGVGISSFDQIDKGFGLRNIMIRGAKIGAQVRFYDAKPGLGLELVLAREDPDRPECATTEWLPTEPAPG